MNIIIRADSSLLIGAGHIMRCLTLALALKKQGADVSFLTRPHAANLNQLIQQFGFNLIVLKLVSPRHELSGYQKWLGCHESDDAKECIQHLKSHHYDWVIIDHYALGELWQHSMRSYVKHIMVIDDLANRMHDVDLLLDQNYLTKSNSYNHLTPKNCQLMIGTRFALLRDEFNEYRAQSLAKKRHDLEHIVISMGGSDTQNMSKNIIQELATCTGNTFNSILLIIGEQNIHHQQLKLLIQQLDLNIRIKVGVNNMAHILSQTDLVIGAAGSSSWERCCLGIPTIQVVLAENQTLIANNLANNHITVRYTKNNLCAQLKAIEPQLTSLSQNASAICDGLGAQRVAQQILNFNNSAK